jgi:hypothetical protein
MLDEDLNMLKATDMVGRNVLQYAALAGNLQLVAVLASAPYTVPLNRCVLFGRRVKRHALSDRPPSCAGDAVLVDESRDTPSQTDHALVVVTYFGTSLPLLTFLHDGALAPATLTHNPSACTSSRDNNGQQAIHQVRCRACLRVCRAGGSECCAANQHHA